MTEPTNGLLPSNEAGKFDERVAATIRTAVDEWRIQNDPVDPHGVSMPEYIRRALADAGLLASGGVDEELAELRDHMSLPADADAVTIVRHAKIAFDLSEAAIAQPKLEQLAAELERLKDVDAEAFAARFQVQCLDIALGRTARVLTRLLTDANITPPFEQRLPHLAFRVEEEFKAVVRQRDEALAALAKQQALLAEARTKTVAPWGFLMWLARMDDVEDVDGQVARRTVTLSEITATAARLVAMGSEAAEPPTRAIVFWEPGERVEYDLYWEGRLCAVPGAVIGDGGTNAQGVHRTAVRTGRMMLGDVYIENHLLRCPREVTEFCGAFDIATDVSMKPCHERALLDSNRCAKHSPTAVATKAEPSANTTCKCIDADTCAHHEPGVSGEADTSSREPRQWTWDDQDNEPDGCDRVTDAAGLLWTWQPDGRWSATNRLPVSWWTLCRKRGVLTEVLPTTEAQQ